MGQLPPIQMPTKRDVQTPFATQTKLPAFPKGRKIQSLYGQAGNSQQSQNI